MDCGYGRTLAPHGRFMRMLTKHAIGAERWATRFLLPPGGVGLDAGDQLVDLSRDLLL